MKLQFRQLEGRSSGFYLLLGCLLALVLMGAGAAWTLEHSGHIASGMNNQIVWGVPHVFAVFLVVAASGALNVASVASVFGKTEYKPLAPLSGLLAIALLAGGLAVLLLDLGRPDRLIVAITHFNPSSIFAWNVILYSGFMGLVVAYLWTMMEWRAHQWTNRVGLAAFVWRLLLTTGTGSIFGFLIGRQAFGSALMGPLFVVYSLAYGLAVFMLVLLAVQRGTGRPLQADMLPRLAKLLLYFVAASLYAVAIYHVTNLYFAKQHALERFLLWDGGDYTLMFWTGQVLLGNIVPIALLMLPGVDATRMALASGFVVLGGLSQMYVTIIGSQAFPLVIFPGFAVESSFGDGVIASYVPTHLEWMLGMGGVGLTGVLVMLALKWLTLLPKA